MKIWRQFISCGLAAMIAGGAFFIHAPNALADREAVDDVPPQVDTAIAGGLAFLAKQQQPDGSFEGGGRIAMTALALMGFLAAGDTMDVGKYGTNVRSALDYLIKNAPDDGYFGKLDGSRMYGHGITTLAIAEASGVETDPARRKAEHAVLDKAVAVILKAQDANKSAPVYAGGWRYEPNSPDSDLSLSGWNALALKAAENVGVKVPADRVHRAVDFVLKCYRADQKAFAYQPGADSSIPMTGVGLLNLYLLDSQTLPQLAPAAKYIVEHPVADNTRFEYYALYYTTQAAFQAGDVTWTAVWKITQTRLVPTQNKQDGGWPQSTSGEEPGRIYATSMALLSLTVPYRLLPIYQR